MCNKSRGVAAATPAVMGNTLCIATHYAGSLLKCTWDKNCWIYKA